MSRIKTVLILMLCLSIGVLPALAESESLISEDMIKAETVNYKTHVVETGTYEKTVSAQAAEYYPYTYNLRFEGSSAKFVEYKVGRGQQVSAGDVLAVFALESGEVSLTAKQINLQNTKDRFDEQVRLRQEEIDDMLESRASISDPWQRELADLRTQRAQVALEQYIYQQQLAIAKLEEELAELEEDQSENVLLAPVDGYIIDVRHKREGDRVTNNEILVEMYSPDVMFFRIKNDYGDFRYGMDVEIAVGSVQNRTYLTGRVIGADTLIPDAQQTGQAFIAIDPYENKDLKLNIPSISTKTQYIENVVLVPKKGATLEGGKYYVTKLEDGAVQKRFVNFVMQNAQYLWIIQGLESGETIILE